MNKNQWQRIEKIFYSAMELPRDERDDFVGQACAGDEELRQEVRALLAANHDAASFLDSPVAMPPHSGTLSPTLVMPQAISNATSAAESGIHVGHYRLLREIGRGGMGAVWLAERADGQFRQQVAIKLLHAGAENEEIIRRFRHERQILASLDHPNIARLHDGGTTEDGRPYFVMEHIEGLPIDEYCRQHQLSVDDRLRLFRQVCAAVHYAHQHLVIHRDLKPGNIIVTDDGAPKLLDFGIAKLLQPDLAQSYDTLSGVTPMTPAYASPEQVRGEKLTTASDVYSLGVVLYELLTGRSPYRLKANTFGELMRAVVEQEPERPSTAITRAGDEPSAAPVTIEPPDKLRRRLAGDIDSIALMALRKEPQARYSSVDQFSEDIRRYLEGLPTQARRGTFSYRALKYIRRNKVPVAAAALILLSLLGGIGATLRQARIAKAAQLQAETEKSEALSQRNRAEAALTTAEERRQQAEAARAEADQQRDEADSQRNFAEEQRARAESQELSNRRLLYTSQMKLAHTAWDESNIERMLGLLAANIPKLGEPDLREFEWYYLWRISHTGVTTLPHSGPVWSVAFSPRGDSLLTIESNGERETLRCWDASSQKEKYRIDGNQYEIGSLVAFSADEQFFATGGYGGRYSCGITLWETSTGRKLRRIGESDCYFWGMALSRDGKKVASTHRGGKVFIFDTQTGGELFSFNLKSQSVPRLAISPDGQKLATISADRQFRLWDANSGKELLSLSQILPLTPPVFTPDGQQVAVGRLDGELVLIDVSSGKETPTTKSSIFAQSLSFSPDGKTLVAGQVAGNQVSLWDTKSWQQTGSIKGHGRPVLAISFSPDGKRVVTATSDKTVKLWDLNQNQESTAYKIADGLVKQIAFSSDGKRLFVHDTKFGTRALDLVTGRELFSTKRHLDEKNSVGGFKTFALSADGKKSATTGDETIAIWDTANGKELLNIKTPGKINYVLAMSKNGQMVATNGRMGAELSRASGKNDNVGHLSVWETKTGKEIFKADGSDVVVSKIVFSLDNRTLITGSESGGGHLTWWDLSAGKRIKMRDTTGMGIYGMSLSPDGTKLAVSDVAGAITLLDARTGQQLGSLKGHNDQVWEIVFSQTGNRLLSGSLDFSVRLWDLTTAQELMVFRGTAQSGGAAFSPDGRSVAVACPQGVVKVFTAADPKSVQVAGR